MWLINTTTIQLEEFFETNLPTYSILSHTWATEEVSHQNMQSNNKALLTGKNGYRKIVDSCAQALKDDFQYIWVDTCCIDKKSSAELSEAINSMYRYYKNAAMCYVYSADVELANDLDDDDLTSPDYLHFKESRWFTRGWTLQELLAPSNMLFYSGSWKYIGSKVSLRNSMAGATGIDVRAIQGRDLSKFSIAQRMSWASKRTTTRLEDQAYCLLGIFDINMPLLYGEGSKAFLRLQEEILRTSDDHSLFAWTAVTAYEDTRHNLFARSPSAFKDSGHITEFKFFRTNPYAMTNQGLTLTLPCVLRRPYLVGVLNCQDDLKSGKILGIVLENMSDMADGPYARVRLGTICFFDDARTLSRDIQLKDLVIPMDPHAWHQKWYGPGGYHDRLQQLELLG